MRRRNIDTLLPVALFLLFAFGLPLLCVFLVKNFAVFQAGTPNLVLYGFEALTPSLSALLVTAIISKRLGVLKFLKKIFIGNIRFSSILLAIAIPFLIVLVAKLIVNVLGGGSSNLITGVTFEELLIIMWALVAEEIGWRGFLQDKLDKKWGFPATPILVGLIWALWHYHFFWLGTLSAPVLLFCVGCITESFGYYWITKRTNGNIIPATLWHFVGNFAFKVFLISPEYNDGSELPYLTFAVLTTIMAVVIIVVHEIRDSEVR
jgi:membrane protease YdiL (CAAX protease family)